jgi:3-hydroxymyristoyl/3-hydroxydecanoyl-(acyl carrier protein) dehydratase
MNAARFVVDAAHPALDGHFPGRPIVPGVVLLAQVQAAIEAGHGPLGALRLPQAKFLRPLLPGEAARIEFEAVAAEGGGRWRFRVLREQDEALLATGELAAAGTNATGTDAA